MRTWGSQDSWSSISGPSNLVHVGDCLESLSVTGDRVKTGVTFGYDHATGLGRIQGQTILLQICTDNIQSVGDFLDRTARRIVDCEHSEIVSVRRYFS